MKVRETPLADAVILLTERQVDARGSFARLLCRDTFTALGLPFPFLQSSLSETSEAGTLRGLHYQKSPSTEGKLVRCLQGSIWDVIVDLRSDSPSFSQHFGVKLSGATLDALWVPPGFAHGQLSLESDCLVEYHMTDVYQPSLAAGIRWNDPYFAIEWPSRPLIINERDANFPDFEPDAADVPARHQTDSA